MQHLTDYYILYLLLICRIFLKYGTGNVMNNNYDLSINKYKKIEYVAVEYPPTSEIMANIKEIEKQISVEMEELEKLLNI